MAALVTVADAILAFPIAYYMAGSPRRVSGACSSSPCSPRSGRATSSRRSPGARCSARGADRLAARPLRIPNPSDWTGLWLDVQYFWLPFMILPDLHGPRAHPAVAARGVVRSRRPLREDVLQGHVPAGLPGRRGRLDLHVLAHARRLHPSRPDRRPAVHRTVIYNERSSSYPSPPRSRWCRSR